MQPILIVEDDPDTVSYVRTILYKRNYQSRYASSVLSAIDSVNQEKPSLILLDIGLPDKDGFSFCSELSKSFETRTIPIIFLSASTDPKEVDRAFRLGAEDYIKKPFSPRELLVKIDKSINGTSGIDSKPRYTSIRKGNIHLDMDAQSAKVGTEEIRLTSKECQVLKILMESEDSMLLRDDLLSKVWGMDPAEMITHTVDEHIYRLRKKLGRAGKFCIRTISKKGFIFRTAK